MRIRCIDRHGQAALRRGNSYPVIELSYDGKEFTYRLIGEGDDLPGIFPAKCFEVIDDRVPSHSVFIFHDTKSFTLTHESFAAEDFWERLFNGEPAEVSAYESVIVPMSRISVTIEFVANPREFSWGSMKFLLDNRWCNEQMAIGLATAKTLYALASEDEIELAGLSRGEMTEVKHLVNKLAEGSFTDSALISDVVMRWYLANFQSAYLDIFKSRLAEKLKTQGLSIPTS